MSKPLDPLDFDPLATLEEMTGKASAPAPVLFEIPFDLDTLAASPGPDETAEALLNRAIAVARAAAAGPATLGPGASPSRAIRHPGHPARQDAPTDRPYPFDNTDPVHMVAILQIALKPRTDRMMLDAIKAAQHLKTAYETRHKGPLSFPMAVRWWWCAARELTDIAALHSRPGCSASTVRRLALPHAAHVFAEAKDIPPGLRASAFESAGVPMPKNKRDRPVLPQNYPPTFPW